MDEVERDPGTVETAGPREAGRMLPLVYDELRRLAARAMTRERPGQTLGATALVHEAYVRLVARDGGGAWENRGHFYAAAAEAMRRILVDNARRKAALKAGGGRARVELDEALLAGPGPREDLIALDEALERLAEVDPTKAELVKLRYFAGLTVREAAEALGLSTTTAERYWTYARAWLLHALRDDDPGENPGRGGGNRTPISHDEDEGPGKP